MRFYPIRDSNIHKMILGDETVSPWNLIPLWQLILTSNLIGFIIVMKTPLATTPQRMFPRRRFLPEQGRPRLECGHHQPWAETSDWVKMNWAAAFICGSWLTWPVISQHHSMDADEDPLGVLFIRSGLWIHLGIHGYRRSHTLRSAPIHIVNVKSLSWG